MLYLPQPTLSAAQTRSQQQASALGCDGIKTRYWWAVQGYTGPDANNNTAAIVIIQDTPFDVTTTNEIAPAPTGLTVQEQAAVLPRATVGTLLPDIITTLAFEARFTPPQISAIQANQTTAPEWTAIKGAALVDFQSASIQKFLSDCLSAGIITQANYTTITALTPLAAQSGQAAVQVVK